MDSLLSRASQRSRAAHQLTADILGTDECWAAMERSPRPSQDSDDARPHSPAEHLPTYEHPAVRYEHLPIRYDQLGPPAVTNHLPTTHQERLSEKTAADTHADGASDSDDSDSGEMHTSDSDDSDSGEMHTLLGKPKLAAAGISCTGLLLLLLNQVMNVVCAEVMQLQEQTGFDGPYFTRGHAEELSTGTSLERSDPTDYAVPLSCVRVEQLSAVQIWLNHSVTGLACFLIGMTMAQPSEERTGRELPLSGFGSRAQAMQFAATMTVLYKFNLFWSAGLPHTSVTVFTGISQSACVVVLGLSVVFLNEGLSLQKVASVAACMAGVVVVCLAQRDGGGTTTVGLVWTLLFTLGQSVYNIAWGCRMSTASQTEVCSVLGLMGLVNAACLWPPLLLVGGPGLSVRPGALLLPQGAQWSLVLVNAGIAAVSNFSLMAGISLTGPMVMTAGSILQLPIAALADQMLHGKTPSGQEIMGYLFIMIGFVALLHERIRQATVHPPR